MKRVLEKEPPMMRLRTASLVVVFYLFTSAATAYAECAWVLWEKVTRIDPKGRVVVQTWEVRTAGTNLDCNRDRTERWSRLSAPIPLGGEGGRLVHLAKHDTLVSFSQPDGGTLERHPVCLPDTVDPRGPKTK
jgi:hypothetical protein